ncbi:hypothetical protein RUND412_011191 [Rhizina undulata]
MAAETVESFGEEETDCSPTNSPRRDSNPPDNRALPPAPRTSIKPLQDSRPAPPQIEILAGPVVPDEINDFSNSNESDDEGEAWGEGDLATGAAGNLLRLAI